MPLHLTKQLQRAIQDDPSACVLFVGAGLSASGVRQGGAGLPTWHALMQDMIADLRDSENGDAAILSKLENSLKEGRYLEVAQVFKQRTRPDQFAAFLKSELDLPDLCSSPLHEVILKTAFRGIITTNFDMVFEHQGTRLQPLVYPQFLSDIDSFRRAGFFAKIHGCVRTTGNPAENLVLTEETYSLLRVNPRYKTILQSLFVMHPVLTVGFSLRDPDFLGILADIREALGESTPTVYSLMFRPDETVREEWRKNGVEIVPYEEHDELLPFFRQLLALTESKRLVQQIKVATRSTSTLFTLPGTHRKNPFFAPKEEVSAALQSLRPGETLLLCGPPGVGKTQHVVQHAQEKRQQYTMVLWASAASVQGLRQSLASLTDVVLPIADTNCSTEERLIALRELLTAEAGWLLILDNADMVDAAREIERFIPSAHNGYVVITSQFTDWTPAFRMERVEVWTESQSSEFLARRLPRCAEDKINLARLGSELGGLPLALEHAAAYIAETGIRVDEYLALLRRDRRSILGRRYPGMTDYRASITATWQVSLRRLGWLARQILHYAACLASEPIPRSILAHLFASVDTTYGPFERRQFRRALMPSDALNLALAELGRYSLVTLSENTFRLHPLLQHVVLDSARLRPWQTRYWLSRLWKIGQSDRSLGAGLWLYRTAHLLNMEGVLPVDYGNDASTLNMRPFIAHLEALSLKTASIRPEVFPLKLGTEIGGIAPLNYMVRWFSERINWYESGMGILREFLETNANGSPHLTTETEWFLSHVEELYQQVVGKAKGNNLAHNLRRLSGVGAREGRRDLYSFLDFLAEEHAEFGDVASAKRLFRFYISHAAVDSEAPDGEVRRARLHEALRLLKHLPFDELQRLLEEALVLYEREDEPFNLDVCTAVWVYARIAKTPESHTRALGWIRQVLPQARKYLAYGCDNACGLTEEYVRIIGDDDESEESLLACEATLRLALRSRRLGREVTATLWQQRGHLLRSRELFLGSARSFARCLALELQHDQPTSFRQIDLHLVTGQMYLKAEAIPAARIYLLKAHDLLSFHWSDIPAEAKDYGAAVGLALGQVQEEAKGEAMLRRALAGPVEE